MRGAWRLLVNGVKNHVGEFVVGLILVVITVWASVHYAGGSGTAERPTARQPQPSGHRSETLSGTTEETAGTSRSGTTTSTPTTARSPIPRRVRHATVEIEAGTSTASYG